MFNFLKRFFGSAQERTVRKYFTMVKEINIWDEKFKSLTDSQLRDKTAEFKARLNKGETLDQIMAEAYAVVKNCCRRLCGTDVHVSGYDQKWDMVPYDVQLVGAIAMHKGAIAEMMTGEGKTLTAVLPLYLNALTGRPVHLVTVNDYLAERDEQWVGSVLRWLGLTTSALTDKVPSERRGEVYRADVVYGTASEFGFDYLRDNSMAQTKTQQVQRGYFFAIVDEIDSILIDEARTPLIISGPVPESRQMYDTLKEGVDRLVKMQRDYCTKIANEAMKVIERADASKKELIEAYRTLWVVSKGTPHNKQVKRLKEDPDKRAELESWETYYHSDQNKEERAELLSALYMTIDEKGNDYELADRGIQAWEQVTGGDRDDFVMIDMGDEYHQIDTDPDLNDEEKARKKEQLQQEDARRKEKVHNLRQLLRAHLLMEKDVDYIIQEGKIVIIDEHTGRPQPGRRFSDGLHQAIEAKEGLEIQKETQTYATITLQNFFRMYDKLSGMTGTAITEAGEFKEIYKLDVLQIPTHHPCIRKDSNDEIYMTEREKYIAIVNDIKEQHEKGRPILVGTESVEVSEKLARILRQNQLPHVVLNAKNHAKEAEIIANAGQKGAITVSTNMAGRGTDIKLGEGAAACGGLYVLGTTRHQSRRIDRQLRGRCARQGDPGSSKFYISFEDQLLRLFASPRLTTIIQKFRPPEGEPISAGILNKSIETAQKRVEQRNFTIRKHTLEYDDVMNIQRKEIYSFRNEILHTDDILNVAEEAIQGVCVAMTDDFFNAQGEGGGWNPEGYRQWLMTHFPVHFEASLFDDDRKGVEEFESLACDKIIAAFRQKVERENNKVAMSAPQGAADQPKRDPIGNAIRRMMIKELDHLWQEHLLAMDHLRSDVSMRSVAQRDPVLEFKQEAFILFDKLSQELRTRITSSLFRFEIVPVQQNDFEKLLREMQLERNRSFVPGDQQEINATSPEQAVVKSKAVPFQVLEPRVGRNDECPCGSGKKYKKCCLK